MDYKHLVLPCGGPDGLIIYGILHGLIEKGIVSRGSIRSIHGVSVGAIISVALATGWSIDVLKTYVVSRPWERIFSLSNIDLLQALPNRGLFDSSIIVEIVRPLLETNSFSPDATMKEFFAATGVAIYMYTVDINGDDTPITMSHVDTPDLTVAEALMRTCCMPLIFTPVIRGTSCYTDGGCLVKCPLRGCIRALGDEYDPKSILVIRHDDSCTGKINTDSTLIEYLMYMIYKFNRSLAREYETKDDSLATIVFSNKSINVMNWFKCIHSRDVREEFINEGIEIAKRFVERVSPARTS